MRLCFYQFYLSGAASPYFVAKSFSARGAYQFCVPDLQVVEWGAGKCGGVLHYSRLFSPEPNGKTTLFIWRYKRRRFIFSRWNSAAEKHREFAIRQISIINCTFSFHCKSAVIRNPRLLIKAAVVEFIGTESSNSQADKCLFSRCAKCVYW